MLFFSTSFYFDIDSKINNPVSQSSFLSNFSFTFILNYILYFIKKAFNWLDVDK